MANVPDISDINAHIKNISLDGKILNSEKQTLTDLNKGSAEINMISTPNSDCSSQDANGYSEVSFDNVVGHLEDMLIDEEFFQVQNSFLEKYWKEFDDSEENKHSYMVIFKEYTNKIEDFIVKYLKKRMSNFEMDRFATELEQKKSSLDGEIFDVLLTLSDFKAFREIFQDYRAMKEGRLVDLRQSLLVSSIQL